MKIANISTIKNELSKYLRYVQQGERVRILDRNHAVADLVPVVREKDAKSDEAELQLLESKGIIRQGTSKIPENLSTHPTQPSHQKSAGVLDALLKERKESR